MAPMLVVDSHSDPPVDPVQLSQYEPGDTLDVSVNADVYHGEVKFTVDSKGYKGK